MARGKIIIKGFGASVRMIRMRAIPRGQVVLLLSASFMSVIPQTHTHTQIQYKASSLFSLAYPPVQTKVFYIS